MRRVCAWLLAALAPCIASDALARPPFWDRIGDPKGAKIEAAREAAVRARAPEGIPSDLELSTFASLFALRAATLLELAGGEALETAPVWYFLGDALVAADRGRDEDGRRMLRRALEADPDSPLAARAWFAVAIASNRLRDFDAEREAYAEALRLQWNPEIRAGIFMNRGEANMSLGQLDRAVEDYRSALAITDDAAGGDAEIRALAAWGLAVALVRANDLPEALRYAWDASNVRFRGPDGRLIEALDLPSVFFTPSYEIYFYRALARMAASDHEKSRAERSARLVEAVELLDDYLEMARPRGDAYAEDAAQLRVWCTRRLSAPARK